MATISTVTGPIDSAELGRTLMHEHLVIGYPGWDTATNEPFDRAGAKAACIDRIAEMQDLGYSSMIDPCPSDLGRDVDLMVEVAEATGFNIICAAGLYREADGGRAHWRFRGQFEDLTGPLTELFVGELSDGIGATGVKPGIIKVATGPNKMTDYERKIFDAAAAASVATGAPITTHTDDGTVGDLQQRVLTEGGVDPQRIVIGHSCGTTDTEYHLRIAGGGSYLGFDRFGIPFVSDDDRVASLARVIEAGAGDRVVVSHDSVWCWKGNPWPVAMREQLGEKFVPTLFDSEIIPKLRDAGVTDDAITALTYDNPRRFFEGTPLGDLGA